MQSSPPLKILYSKVDNKSPVHTPSASSKNMAEVQKQRLRDKRLRQIEAAKELLIKGSSAKIWIFVLSKIGKTQKLRIENLYRGKNPDDKSDIIVPVFTKFIDAQNILESSKATFKIACDLSNIEDVMNFSDSHKIDEIYIYNQKGYKGVSLALYYKQQTRKIKGIYHIPEIIITMAQQEIDNQILISLTDNEIKTNTRFKKFPNFLRLSGEDKSEATLYRVNLYGARNLMKQDRASRYEDFISLIKEKYGKIKYEVDNIKEYESLNHEADAISIQEASKIINFYAKQSFYYRIVNSMLRTMKTTEEFKLSAFPFYETYNSIKLFYLQKLKGLNRKITSQRLYRGAKLRDKDFDMLKPGNYIEMFGFMSTSKKFETAKQFADSESSIFCIHIPSMQIPQIYDKYDHGFIDLNEYKLAGSNEGEEEVLFNALNIYKVTKIQTQDGFRMIHLNYAAIFQILAKKRSNLVTDQSDVLINYQYCTNLIDKIQDQGDVHLFANEFPEAKQYYESKIKLSKAHKKKYLFKYAQVLQRCGQIAQAQAAISELLSLQKQNELSLPKQQIVTIYSTKANISSSQEDYVKASTQIQKVIKLLQSNQNYQRAKMIHERGTIEFRKGEIRLAENDYLQCTNTLKMILQRYGLNYKVSFCAKICSCCCFGKQTQIESEVEEAMLKQVDISILHKLIKQQLIKVNNSLKQIAIYTENKVKFDRLVKQCQILYLQINSEKTDDPIQKANINVLKAIVQQDNNNIQSSETLLEEAIQLIQKNLGSFDNKIAQYSTILANTEKKQLNKTSFTPKISQSGRLNRKGLPKIQFDKQAHTKMYEKCKDNFQRALNVHYYNKKSNESPQIMVLKNQIGELDFNQEKLKESSKILQEVRDVGSKNPHSEVARSCLLLSKISLSKGQLKDAFQKLSESQIFLKQAMIKDQNEQYIIIFENHIIFREIVLHRAKIYMKQLNYDMSLKDIKYLHKILDNTISDSQCQSIKAALFQLQAENILKNNLQDDFEEYFLKAIDLRKKQMGSFNLPNAVTYCNYAKYMILINDLQKAEKLIAKSAEIFSFFAQGHPIRWLLLYCLGIFDEQDKRFIEAEQNLSKCYQLAKTRFDSHHVTILIIKFEHARVLFQLKRYNESHKMLRQLQNDLSQGLRQSSQKHSIESERDDEKMKIKNQVQIYLKKCKKNSTKSLSILDQIVGKPQMNHSQLYFGKDSRNQ